LATTEQDKLVKTYQPEIKRANMIFLWLLSLEEDDLLLVDSVMEEVSDNRHELPAILIDSDDNPDPALISLGIWEMAQDFPYKLSG
jgi:hypothetical protein